MKKKYIRHPRLLKKPLILYPAGEHGRSMLRTLRALKVEPAAFCDSNKAKTGTEICRVPVKSLEQLIEAYGTEGAVYIVNSAFSYSQIEARLLRYGVPLENILSPNIYLFCDTGTIERPMKMSSSDEVKLRACMLDLLCFLHSVCEKYDIPYYITSGTLLGAVRHKGFIPWDDDIDVALLRKDYNRFYQVVRKELGDKYAIQEMPSRNNLALKDSVFRLFANGQETMVMIDTFPIDNVPSPFTRFLSIQTRTAMCFFRFAQICGWDHKRSALRVLGRLCRHLGILVEQAFNFLETQWVHYFTWDTPNRFPDGRYAVYDKCLIGCRVLLEFEGHLFYGPERYDECLRQMYGDYMMLPPVEARVPPHAISELKFPKGSGTY